MKLRGMIILLIAIPLVSVLMGAVLLTVSIRDADQRIVPTEQPLSKTSWRQTDD